MHAPTYQTSIMLFIILGIAANSAVCFFFFLPSILQITNVRIAIEEKKQEILDLRENNQSPEYVRGLVDELTAPESILHDAVLQKGRELAFIETLEAQAQKHNVEQQINIEETDQPEAGDKSKGLIARPIQLTVHGSYRDVLLYMRDIDTLPAYVNFGSVRYAALSGEKVEITQTATSDQDNQLPTSERFLNVTITGTTYWE